ncbi:ATP-grasp domain-containing protein [Actinacidiphila glaucinigra]|uniref:ATP-grasp domain-containing protein n=1 Tax=Actinacidiphila glaucinigra TaxID=235986 RepID=A0A239HF18_9ACTN|nr:ATP-grasp domain-containing protein [Actinacidiphila glaucinigra]SNS79967.1 ATP-grasp domain-containing protein [Actinacidiphila glaucinigra]
MALRIWLSSAGVATTQVMRMLRGNPDSVDVRIHGTNVDPSAPALAACDVAEVEPRHVGDDAYADFALDFCRRHGIDVLVPPRRLTALAGRADAFAAEGTRLMCSPLASVEILTSKSRTYEEALTAGIPVPPWRVVRDADGLRAAVDELAATGETLCIKPAGEYSAFGFRILEDRPMGIRDLLAPARPMASVDAVAQAMKRAADEGEHVPRMIVMPYLEGPEISVDCLSAPGGRLLAAIPRAKEGRYRLLLDDPGITEIASRLVGHFSLAYLSNVQLRHRNGEPVLLEANPRPSAGIFQTAFTGVNLPWAAVRLLTQGDAGLRTAPRLGGRVAVTEAVTEVPEVPDVPEVSVA